MEQNVNSLVPFDCRTGQPGRNLCWLQSMKKYPPTTSVFFISKLSTQLPTYLVVEDLLWTRGKLAYIDLLYICISNSIE